MFGVLMNKVKEATISGKQARANLLEAGGRLWPKAASDDPGNKNARSIYFQPEQLINAAGGRAKNTGDRIVGTYTDADGEQWPIGFRWVKHDLNGYGVYYDLDKRVWRTKGIPDQHFFTATEPVVRKLSGRGW